jgi:chaperonin cofactor prefoldin
MVPNDNIDTYIKNLVTKAGTELNIARSGAAANGVQSGQAKEIEKLRSLKNIFLSLPTSEDGNDIRKNFIISVEGKIKYDTPKWPYAITPGINEAKEISDTASGDPEKLGLKLTDPFIYSILIVGSPEDLTSPLFNKQYELAKKANTASALNHTILWFLNSEVKDEIEKLDEDFKIALKMLPTIVGTDSKSIFKLIEEFDTTREKKIKELSTPFSPVKKVYMFYDYTKDNENDLRIKLKKKIQEDKQYAVRDLSYDTIENEKKEIEECNGAVIFYGSGSDSIWYKMRERIILKAKNIKCGAVCVDGTEEPEIEKKIDRDVSITEILPIKGEKELETGITNFKTKLQGE